MKTTEELYNERISRFKKAIALEKPDRTPVMAYLDSFGVAYTGAKMSRFSKSIFYSTDIALKTFLDFPTFDATEIPITPTKMLGAAFLSKVKTAGKELPEGSLWQIDEKERMSREDYDDILKMGWIKFRNKFWKQRLGVGKLDIIKAAIGGMRGVSKFKKAGILVYSDVPLNPPNEPLMGGRSMAKFLTDLYKMPDKVKAVMDVIFEESLEEMRDIIKKAKPFGVFLGAARGGSAFISPKLWERFIWPYLLKGAEEIVKCGVYVNLHFDGDWMRELNRFTELPKKKCVWACDGTTDIFAVKKALDGHMCIKGDVPPSLLVLGTPDEVYKYCVKLVREIGPSGFILAPGCTLPMNAKAENVKAMISAVTGR